MENKAHALAAGAFVLIVSALLVGLAFWLTRDTGVRVAYDVSTRDTITGLQPEATVRYRGINVGKVSTIGFDRQIPGNVLIRIEVNSDTPITRSTFASLGFQGVTGIAFVQLDDTGASKEKPLDGGGQPPRIPMRPGLVDQLAGQSTRILAQLEETTRRVNLLLSPENQKKLMSSLESLQLAAESVPPTMKEANATFQSFRETSSSVAVSAEEVRKTAADFARISLRIQQAGGALDQLTQGVGALAGTSQVFQADTLPRINRTVDEAGRAARQVGRVAGTMSDHPQALIFGGPLATPGPGEPGFTAPAEKP